jgi:hypothetical protein
MEPHSPCPTSVESPPQLANESNKHMREDYRDFTQKHWISIIGAFAILCIGGIILTTNPQNHPSANEYADFTTPGALITCDENEKLHLAFGLPSSEILNLKLIDAYERQFFQGCIDETGKTHWKKWTYVSSDAEGIKFNAPVTGFTETLLRGSQYVQK